MPIALRFPIALVLSIVYLAAPAWADFQAGVDAYELGNYATALHEWRPLADRGVAEAQYNLGVLYGNGYGVPQDFVQAYKWYNLAATYGEKSGVEARDVQLDDLVDRAAPLHDQEQVLPQRHGREPKSPVLVRLPLCREEQLVVEARGVARHHGV